MIKITSRQNSIFKKYTELTHSHGIKKNQEFILMGQKLIYEYLELKKKPEFIAEILHPELEPLTDGKAVFEFSKELFNEIDCLGTGYNLFAVKLPTLDDLLPHHEIENLEVVAPLSDPGNLGALMRSALGFGLKKIILTRESAHPFHPKSVKASAGALLHLQIYKSSAALVDFCDHELSLGLDSRGQDLREFQWPAKARLIIGEEGQGFALRSPRRLIKIQTEKIESLNAVVASSLAFYEWNRRRL